MPPNSDVAKVDDISTGGRGIGDRSATPGFIRSSFARARKHGLIPPRGKHPVQDLSTNETSVLLSYSRRQLDYREANTDQLSSHLVHRSVLIGEMRTFQIVAGPPMAS